jgi:hypothetical protein
MRRFILLSSGLERSQGRSFFFALKADRWRRVLFVRNRTHSAGLAHITD